MKKALVTGAAGFIGLNMVKELLNRGFAVSALIDKGNEISRKRLYSINKDIEIIEDIAELMNQSHRKETYDVIFHLATVGVTPNYDDIELICDVNIKMGCKLVDFVKSTNSKLLVNFGSCFEYGDHGSVLLTEDMMCKPESLYAISKNASTRLVTEYAKNKNVNLITVRPFGVFGEGEGIKRLAPSIIMSCLEGKTVNTTEGNQIRDFVNVKDVVKAVIELTEAEYKSYEIYNICSNNPVKVKDFIREIVDVCQFDNNLIKFGALPYRINEAMVFAGKNDKLQKLINYNFTNDHKEGILDIYNSIKQLIN